MTNMAENVGVRVVIDGTHFNIMVDDVWPLGTPARQPYQEAADALVSENYCPAGTIVDMTSIRHMSTNEKILPMNPDMPLTEPVVLYVKVLWWHLRVAA